MPLRFYSFSAFSTTCGALEPLAAANVTEDEEDADVDAAADAESALFGAAVVFAMTAQFRN